MVEEVISDAVEVDSIAEEEAASESEVLDGWDPSSVRTVVADDADTEVVEAISVDDSTVEGCDDEGIEFSTLVVTARDSEIDESSDWTEVELELDG